MQSRDIPSPEAPPISLTASDGTGLRIVSMTARGVVEDPLAFTELHLTFENPSDRQIEGHFDITLPPSATISRFAMRQQSGWQEGEVVELQAARRAYEDFLHRRQDPALMEKQPGNHFRARVFPILPRERKELLVSFSQERAHAEEPYRVHLRGLPELQELDIRVILSTCEESPAAAGRGGALAGTTLSQRTVKLQRRAFTPDGDFEVPVPAAAGPRIGLRHDNLVVARVIPAASAQPDAIQDLLVLFDSSASRALGFHADVDALGALLKELGAKQPKLPLRLCCFDQEVHEFFRGPLGELGDEVLQRIKERGALGASDLQGALAAARAERVGRVLLISDGVPTAGPTEAAELRPLALRLQEAGVERLDALCCGGIRDEALLRELCTCGLPRAGIVADGGAAPGELARRLSSATLRGVRVSVPGSAWVWPTQLDGLQPGDQVLVFADLPAQQPFSVVLDGGEPQQVTLATAERPLLERAWVNARLRRLQHQRDTLGAQDPDLREALRLQIIELSTRHRVLSDFTALLVLETEDDYRRFGIDRRALSDILTVGPTGIEVLHRKQAVTPTPIAAAPAPQKDIAAPAKSEVAAEESRRSPDKKAKRASAPRQPEPVMDFMEMEMERGPSDAGEGAAAPMAMLMDEEVAGAAPEMDMPMPVVAAAPGAPMMAPPPASMAPPAPAPMASGMAPPRSAAPAPMAPPAARASSRVEAPQAEGTSLWNRVSRALRRESEAPAPPPRPAPPAAAAPRMQPPEPERAREIAAPPPVQPTAPEVALPYEGPLLQVMQLIRKGELKQALAAARRFREGNPGDVLALVALGEALEALGERSEAARVYGSIIDLFPGRADLRRFAGARLDRLGAQGLTLAADTFRKARAQRPDHPASHRLLAFALCRAGQYAEALAVIIDGAQRSYASGRFPGVPRILKEDVGLIAAAWLRAEPAQAEHVRGLVQQAGASVPTRPSLRFVLNWETDANDVDFHIHDGKGGHAYYSSKQLPSGGELYADVTTGYGPECFTIEGEPQAFPYRLQAHYFSRGPMGYGMGKLEIMQHDGQGGLRFEQRTFVIMQDRAFVDLGQVTGPLC